jgi:hypothetical protein
MEFPNAEVKAITAKIGSGVITLAFEVKLDEVSLETAQALAVYADKDHGKVELRIIPQQPPLIAVRTFSAVAEQS